MRKFSTTDPKNFYTKVIKVNEPAQNFELEEIPAVDAKPKFSLIRFGVLFNLESKDYIINKKAKMINFGCEILHDDQIKIKFEPFKPLEKNKFIGIMQ